MQDASVPPASWTLAVGRVATILHQILQGSTNLCNDCWMARDAVVRRLVMLTQAVAPDRAATRIQAAVRGWRSRTNLVPKEEAELRFLGMAPAVSWHCGGCDGPADEPLEVPLYERSEWSRCQENEALKSEHTLVHIVFIQCSSPALEEAPNAMMSKAQHHLPDGRGCEPLEQCW